MANSSDSFTSTSPSPTSYTATELAAALNLGPDFAKYLAQQQYSDDDPIVLVDWLTLQEQDKQQIFQLLTNWRLIDGQYNVFSTQIGTGGIAFKFETWKLYDLARKELRRFLPWVFYTPNAEFYGWGENVYPYPSVPTAATTVITFYSESRFKVTNQQFFEL